MPDSSKICAEASFFHYGFDRVDGIFFDTGSTRGPIHWGQELEDRDIDSHVEIVSFVKNFWRDYVLDKEAVVITNGVDAGFYLFWTKKMYVVKTRALGLFKLIFY